MLTAALSIATSVGSPLRGSRQQLLLGSQPAHPLRVNAGINWLAAETHGGSTPTPQQKAEMEEQQKAFAAFIDDDDVPDDLDEDVDDLPMDSDVTPPKKKKKVVKAQSEVAKPESSKEGKLFRTKDGEYYRIVDGKKIRVKKKTE